jgi:hypothetical protein
MNVLRVEGIEDRAARDEFYRRAPFRIFRVSPTAVVPAPTPSAAWPSFSQKMRTRWTGHSESVPGVSTAELEDGLRQLEIAVLQRNSRSRFDHAQLAFKSFVNDSGYECLAEGSRCQGDCRDTIYAKATFIVEETLCNKTHLPCRPASRSELTEDPRDMLYVIGVNHERTNQSVYSSLTLYDFPKLAAGMLVPGGHGPGQYTLMDEDYGGSAAKYLPTHLASRYLYVVKFARKCSLEERDFCVEVPSTSSTPGDITMGLSSQLVFIERMYIHPGTRSGPAVAETLLPKLLHFRPRLFAQEAFV